MPRALNPEQALLSTIRPAWTEKDLAVELACHQWTVKRWWKRLGVAPDKGTCPNLWTQRRAEKLVRARRDWLLMRGFNPATHCQKFSGKLPDDSKQLNFPFRLRRQ